MQTYDLEVNASLSRVGSEREGSAKNCKRHGLKVHSIAYVLLGPGVVLFCAVVVYGIIYNVENSLRLASGHGFGLSNYGTLLHDRVFWLALGNNGLWLVVCVGVQLLIGYSLALLTFFDVLGRRLVKGVVFVPVVLSPVVVSLVWDQMYNPTGGLLVAAQRLMGLGSGINYLGSPRLAIFSVAVVNIWQWTGFSLLLGSSALQNVPKEVTEAAVVDGAGLLTVARKILVPYLRPATITLIVLGVIGSLQTFALVFVMTGGGPGNASQVLGTYIYKVAFSENEFSYGSTVSVALLVVTLVVTVVQLRIVSRIGGRESRS